MLLCPPPLTVLDPHSRIPATSLAQVLWELLPYTPLSTRSTWHLLSSYTLHSRGCPPWHSLSLSGLWTVPE